MCGEAYKQSALIAKEIEAFKGFAANREPMFSVMNKHSLYADKISDNYVPTEFLLASREVWKEAITLGKEYGYRNGQATVLAPTGTIGFMMDCDTTGVEPDIALVKYKKLVGGGMMKIVNQTVPKRSENLATTASRSNTLSIHRKKRHHRRRPVFERRTSFCVRLRIQTCQGRTLHSIYGTH